MIDPIVMDKNLRTSILSVSANIWDGSRQLSGNLELWEKQVIFKFADFKFSHLNLYIPLKDIENAEEFLVFNLAKNGLRIENKDGKYDMFVLEEGAVFKKALHEQLKKLEE